jgi:hypothetical protein
MVVWLHQYPLGVYKHLSHCLRNECEAILGNTSALCKHTSPQSPCYLHLMKKLIISSLTHAQAPKPVCCVKTHLEAWTYWVDSGRKGSWPKSLSVLEDPLKGSWKLDKNGHSLPFIYPWESQTSRLVPWLHNPMQRLHDRPAQPDSLPASALQCSCGLTCACTVMSHE